MNGTFIREPIERGATIIPERVDANIFTPSLPNGKRVLFLISDDDLEAFDAQGYEGAVRITDLLTDTEHLVARGLCGLGCACGADLVDVEP